MNNLLSPYTLWCYGKRLSEQHNAVLPGEVPKEKPFWSDDTRNDLLCCAKRAFLSSRIDKSLDLFAGFRGNRSTFQSRLREEFLVLHPDFMGDFARELGDLRSKGVFPEELIQEQSIIDKI